MDHQLLGLLHKKLEDERKRIVENLGDGVAKDYADYKHLCGVIRGLLTAQSEINDLLRKLKDDDE